MLALWENLGKWQWVKPERLVRAKSGRASCAKCRVWIWHGKSSWRNMIWWDSHLWKPTGLETNGTFAALQVGRGVNQSERSDCGHREERAQRRLGDGFTFYKLPKRQDKEDGETGLEYLYLDSTIRSWRRSKQLMNSTKSVLGRTLQQLYEADASEVWGTSSFIWIIKYLKQNSRLPEQLWKLILSAHLPVPVTGSKPAQT